MATFEEERLPGHRLEAGVVGLPDTTGREVEGDLRHDAGGAVERAVAQRQALGDEFDRQFARRGRQAAQIARVEEFGPAFRRHRATERLFVAGSPGIGQPEERRTARPPAPVNSSPMKRPLAALK